MIEWSKYKGETIFVQPLFNNFISHTHIIFLLSLFIFPSLLFLTNKKREKWGCHESCWQIVVQISLFNTKVSWWLYKGWLEFFFSYEEVKIKYITTKLIPLEKFYYGHKTKEKVFGHTHIKNIFLIIRRKLIKKDDWIFWWESFYVCIQTLLIWFCDHERISLPPGTRFGGFFHPRDQI